MAKKKKQKRRSASRATGGQAQPEIQVQFEAQTEPKPAPQTQAFEKDNPLGEFAGITMGEKKEKEKEPEVELPTDEIVFSVSEDRTRLLVTGVLYLLLAFVGLFLVAGGLGATQISQNVAYMMLAIVGLPLAWFTSKAMGRRFHRFASHVDVIDFGKHNVFIYDSADPEKAIAVSYKDIKNYKTIRQGRAVRLLLSGDWVSHPSGYKLIDINRPFMATTLDDVETNVKRVMREHRVNERR